ncbi:hypothetical protein PTKIN_Ptkin11bG0079700 [Pterospermum kingtungense]
MSQRLELALYVGWCLWRHRNRVYHQGSAPFPVQVWSNANSYLAQYTAANLIVPVLPNQPVVSWCSPPQGILKPNVDEGFNDVEKPAACGFVVRNETGSVLLSGALKFEHVESVLHAELLAILFGLESVTKMELKPAIVESDSLTAIAEIHRGSDSNIACFGIVMDILFFGEVCDVLKFVHVNSAANVLAHRVVKVSELDAEPSIWLKSLSESIFFVD